jgi:formylglycine-generating enzyme required for sulfatase activity
VNSIESGLKGTTAVCTYPQGKSPTNAWDMSGNIWEWCNSSSGPSVLRGGAFNDDPNRVRGAVRGWNNPDGWSNYSGFRLVVSPFALTDEGLDTELL